MEFPHQDSCFPFGWSATCHPTSLLSDTCPGCSHPAPCSVGGGVSGVNPGVSERSGPGTRQDTQEIEELGVRCGGLRVVGIDSDSDSEDLGSGDRDSYDLDPQFDQIEELERDEDNRAEILTVSSENFSDEDEDPVVRTFEWEILLAIINARRDSVMYFNPHMAGRDGEIWNPESDPLWQHVAEEVTVNGNPPASKNVVENLPTAAINEADLKRNGGICAVCKDEVSVGEIVKRLPCLHYYHGDCILPWLEIRNSCPVCKFELPTDDLDYERRKIQGSISGLYWNWDAEVSLDFELVS
ncbi:hypothetical protein SAY87_007621 [Trapa incisa]|uniref:RING-type E3 ubiquitin transferase n=1 Tax=Trapa incisa TaxID=236973 RepID=A0AAN7QFH3_9MYRT|nr:hypothetical protein SAY87_007621 [Trapa incisa]